MSNSAKPARQLPGCFFLLLASCCQIMVPQSTDSLLHELRQIDHKIHRLSDIRATLEWDQETNLPSGGVDERSEQLALLGGMIHDLQTSPLLGTLVTSLAEMTLPTDEDRAMVRLHRREYDRASKLPKELVERQARLVGQSQPLWAQARKENNFAKFAPYLAQLVDLAREKAELIGYIDHPYDALLDEYEPGTTSAEVKAVFDGLEAGVADLVRRIAARPQVRNDFLTRNFPRDVQEKVGRQVAGDLGFDWTAGSPSPGPQRFSDPEFSPRRAGEGWPPGCR